MKKKLILFITICFLALWYFIIPKEEEFVLPIFTPSDLRSNLVHPSLAGKTEHTVPDFSFTDQNGNTVTEQTVNNKIYVVSPSRKLLSFANDSKILKKFSKNLIPWPIDKTNYYKKLNNYRKFFNLPTEKKLVIFACNNGIKDNRKGFDLFYESIKFSKNYYDVVILGSPDLENFSNIYIFIFFRKFCFFPFTVIHWRIFN